MAVKWNQLSRNQQAYARQLADQLHAAGVEISVTRVGSDLDAAEELLAQAQREQAAAARKAAAEKSAAETATQPEATETTPAADPAQLVAALRAAGRTARQIAAACGVHASTVYRWARGLFRPAAARLAVLLTLASA